MHAYPDLHRQKNNMATKFNVQEQYRKYYRSLEPMLLKPKNKMYSTVIFFFLVVALFGWYAIRPTIQTIIYLRREIIDKKEVNQKMDEKIQSLIAAQALMESNQQRLSLIEDAVPKNPEAIILVKQLRDTALIAGASISAIQVSSVPVTSTQTTAQKTTQTVNHVTFPITITIEGSYQTLMSFLQTLGSMRRVILIDSLTFSPNKKVGSNPGTSVIQLVLQTNTYYESF